MSHREGTFSMAWMGHKGESGVRQQVSMLGLILVVFVLVTATTLALVSALKPEVPSGVVAGVEASSARWNALGAYWSGESEARMAYAARWAAFGVHNPRDYEAIAAANSARWSALGEWYQSQVAAGVEASSARWSALGGHYLARYEAAAAASSARYQALAAWYARQAAHGD